MSSGRPCPSRPSPDVRTREETDGPTNHAGYATLFADSGVPTAVMAYAAEDISIHRYAERSDTVVRWTNVDTGGHFAALEQPGSLVADFRAFVREPCAAVAELGTRGIETGDPTGTNARIAQFFDPAGNTVTLAEIGSLS